MTLPSTTPLSFTARVRWRLAGLLGLLLGAQLAQAQPTYCNTGLGGGTCDITQIAIANTSFNTAQSTCPSSGDKYSIYSPSGAETATLELGQTYQLDITVSANDVISLWIDYDQNGTYDASEWTQVAATTTAGTGVSASFQVPSSATAGLTGLRIRTRLSGNMNGATDACTNFGSGETRDYGVTLGIPINTTTAAPYCAAPHPAGCTSASITRVTLTSAGLNNGSACVPNAAGSAFYNYAAVGSATGTVTQRANYPLNVTLSSAASSVGAWVDWNRNQQFEASEFTLLNLGTGGTTANATLAVPTTASLGTTRLRIRTRSSGAVLTGADACLSLPSGETEDYTLTVQAQCALQTPVTVTAGGPTSICAGGSVTLTAAGVPLDSYAYSAIPYAPLPAGTQPGPTGDDAVSGTLPIGFAFTFWGTTYTDFVISTNGNIQFDAPGTATFTPPAAPNAATPNNYIGLLWTDLDLRTSGTITYDVVGTAPNRKLVIDYTNVPFYTQPDPNQPQSFTGQLVLSEGSNWIEMFYGVQDGTAPLKPKLQGLENADGTRAVTVVDAAGVSRNATNWQISGPEGWRFVPASSTPFAWTPTTGLSDPTALTTTVSPTTTTTYTFTAQDANGCTNVASTTVTVAAPAAPGVTDASRCGAGSVTLQATGAPAGGTYQWYTVATGGTPIPNQTGASYLIPNLTATTVYYVNAVSNNGCIGPRTAVTATINPEPTATLTAGGNTAFCAGGAVTLTASGAGTGGTYQFLLNGQPVNGTTATTLVATAAGTYTVVATNATTCSATSSAVTVTINPAPTATLTAGGNTTFCAGGSVTLTAAGTGTGNTYQFLLNGQPVNGTTATTLVATAAGTYTVVATNAATCSATSSAVTVTVNPAPSAAFAYATSTFCRTSATDPAPSITGSTGGTFTASPTGLVLNATTGIITLGTSAVGTYVVTYSVGGTCPASATQTVTVTSAPVAAFTYTTGTTLCAGAANTLPPTLSVGASAGTFSASPAGLAIDPSTGNVTLASSAAGTYTITNSIAASGSCTASTASTTITIEPAPVATLTSNGSSAICAGTSLTLTASGAGTGGSYQFVRDGQPINGATGLTYEATQAGTYTVVATNAAGCSATSTDVTVTVTPQPTATFSYPTNSFCLSSTEPTATITGTAGGVFSASPAGLTLDATTGAITLGTSAAGTYTVRYTVGTTCTARDSATVVINPAPAITLTAAGPTTICAGDSLTLTANTTGTVQLLLDGQPISGAAGNSYVATQAGSYTAVVTDAAGCQATSAPVTVAVTPLPTATFAYANGTTFCLSGTAPVATVTGTAGGVFSASPAGLTLDAATGAVTLGTSTAGTYTVRYTVGATCTARDSVSLTLTAAPRANFAYAAPAFCVTTAAGTTAPATLGTGASNGAFAATTTGLVVDAATGAIDLVTSQPGTYIVRNALPAANGCAAVLDSTTVTINPLPVVTVNTTGATTFCQGDSVTLTASGGTSYLWSNGATTASIVVRTDGTYSVTGTSAAGCASAPASTTVTVNPLPVVTVNTTGATTFCQGDSVTLTASGGTSYLWSNGATTATIVVRTGGTYSVTGTSATGCAAATTPTTVVVNPLPAAPTLTLTQLPSGAVLLTSSAATGNQFLLNGQPINGATADTYTVTNPAMNGVYTVQVADGTTGCVSPLSNAVTTTVTSTPGTLAIGALSVYPNPTPDGALTLELRGYRQPVTVTLFDALGRLVYAATLPAPGATTTYQALNLRPMPTGVYTLRAATEAGVIVRRVVRN